MRQCSNPACLRPINWNKQPDIVHHGDHVEVYCDAECRITHQRGTEKRRINWLFVAAVLIALGVAFKAWGAPPEAMDSPLPYADWFESVHNREGVWCCRVSDGHMTDYRITEKGYVVRIEGHDFVLPFNDERISVRHDKPFTGGVVWWYKNSDDSISIRCFVADDAT